MWWGLTNAEEEDASTSVICPRITTAVWATASNF